MPSCELLSVVVSDGPSEFWDLLSLSVGYPTPEKMALVRRRYGEELGCGLIAAVLDGCLVGAVGYQDSAGAVEVKHLAVRPDKRRSGIARTLIQGVIATFPGKVLFAETHDGAVGFYNRLGFQSKPLPRKLGSETRWKCRREIDFEE